MREDEDKESTFELSPDTLSSALDVIRQLRTSNPELMLDLTGANLKGFDLRGMDLRVTLLREVELAYSDLRGANLAGVDMTRSSLIEAKLQGANLEGARLMGVNLFGANLYRAKLSRSVLSFASIIGAGLGYADLTGADLKAAQLCVVNMNGAILRGANLLFASFYGADLAGVDFEGAIFNQTVLAASDLSGSIGIDLALHDGASTLDGETLRSVGGQISENFLRGCGLDGWEVSMSRLYGQLSPAEVQQVCSEILDARLKGRSVRLFISYAHADYNFVSKLYKRLQSEGFTVWLDRHELSAGSLQLQVHRALAEQDIVLVVLSRNSVESDWVENELEMARHREKGERRDLLCPIALDDTWQAKLNNQTQSARSLWRKLGDKYVIDFSGWKTKRFEVSFKQLTRGIRKNYNPESPSFDREIEEEVEP